MRNIAAYFPTELKFLVDQDFNRLAKMLASCEQCCIRKLAGSNGSVINTG